MNALPTKEVAPNDFWPNIISFSLILTLLNLDVHFAAWRSFAFTMPIGLFYAAAILYRVVAGHAALSARVMHWLGVTGGLALFAIAFATRSGHIDNAIYFFSKKAMSLPLAIDSAAGLLVGFHLSDVVYYWLVKMYRIIKIRFRDKP